jgi:hypothetical protein
MRKLISTGTEDTWRLGLSAASKESKVSATPPGSQLRKFEESPVVGFLAANDAVWLPASEEMPQAVCTESPEISESKLPPKYSETIRGAQS